MKNKVWMFVLAALCALLFLLPAAGAETVASGACGDGLNWEIDAQGVLTISGSGAMDDYDRNWDSDNKESTAP